MTFEEIVAKAKEIAKTKDLSDYKEHLAVEIKINGDGEGTFYVEIKDGQIAVEPYNYYDHDCCIICDAKLLLGLMEGTADGVASFLTGKLKIQRSVDKALEFQNLFKENKSKKTKKK